MKLRQYLAMERTQADPLHHHVYAVLVQVATPLARGEHGAVGAGVPAKGEQRAADVLGKKDLTHAMLTNSIKIGIPPAR